MAPQLYRRKNKNRPKLLQTCKEIKEKFENNTVLENYGFSLDKKSKMYIDTILCENHCFCVFKSQAVIDMITHRIDKNKRHYLLDGTFKICAKPFKQLLTLSVEYKNNVRFLYKKF